MSTTKVSEKVKNELVSSISVTNEIPKKHLYINYALVKCGYKDKLAEADKARLDSIVTKKIDDMLSCIKKKYSTTETVKETETKTNAKTIPVEETKEIKKNTAK